MSFHVEFFFIIWTRRRSERSNSVKYLLPTGKWVDLSIFISLQLPLILLYLDEESFRVN